MDGMSPTRQSFLFKLSLIFLYNSDEYDISWNVNEKSLNMPSLLYQYFISAQLNNKTYQIFINLTSPYRILSCPHVLWWFHSVKIHIRILSKHPSYKILAVILKLDAIIFCNNPHSKLKQTIMDTNWPWITLYYHHLQLVIQTSITANNHSLLTFACSFINHLVLSSLKISNTDFHHS